LINCIGFVTPYDGAHESTGSAMSCCLPTAKAGAAYFAIVFGIALALGIFRGFVLTPMLGAEFAVAAEIPIVLGVSWVSCGWTIRRFSVPSDFIERALMGATAFVWLMAAELGLSMALFGRTFADHIAIYKELPEQMGLLAQIGFGTFPALQLSRHGKSRNAA
jgi:hypothetical protein